MLVCACPGWFDDGMGGFCHHVTVPAAFNTSSMSSRTSTGSSDIHVYTGSRDLP